MTNAQVLKCFWLPNTHYRTISSGIDENTIRNTATNAQCKIGLEEMEHQRIKRIIADSANVVVNTEHRRKKYLGKGGGFPYGFSQIINDALHEIYKGHRGFVFNDQQAMVVCSFLTSPEIEIRDGFIYISDKTKKR